MKMLLTALVLNVTAIPVVCQVVPQARGGGSPLSVGVAYSNYASDWNGRLQGPTLWVDWNFYRGPQILRRFGIGIEGRDLNYGRTGTDPKLRMDTIAGGPIYTFRQDRRLRPFVRFFMGYGSIDFNIRIPNYTHDTRTIYAPGGGLEYQLVRNISVQGKYEYQYWNDFFNHHALNPHGLTIGAVYQFGRYSVQSH